MSSAILKRAATAALVASEHADAAESGRRLPSETVAALAEAQMFTLCLPAAYGGAEADPQTFVDAIETVAHGDGAAGWCTMVASTTSSMSVFLEPETARRIFSSPSVATAGVFAPNAIGARAGDGYSVTGRWQWGSGTQHSAWILGGARCDDETQRSCFFPVSDVEFHDTWHTSGLRGTGSLDFSVDCAWVPVEHTVQPGVSPARVDSALAHFPNFTLLAIGVAGAALGIARRALDEVAELAGAKTPQFSSKTLAQSGFAQNVFAKAEAEWRSARAFLRDEIGQAWSAALAGQPVPVARRVGMRLAAAHVASACADVVDAVYTVAGGSAVYDTSVLGRCLRDAHVVTQHIMVAPKLNETLGKFLLGVDFDARMI